MKIGNHKSKEHNDPNLQNDYEYKIGHRINRRFVNLEGVTKYLYCPICEDIFYDPRRLSCGHTFCFDCILKWGQSNSHCPICRQYVQINEDLQPDLIGKNLVNELEVYCCNVNCPFKNKLEDLNEHLKICAFDPNKLPESISDMIKPNKPEEKNSKENKGTHTESSSFNTNVSLKARLYAKNPGLIQNIISKGKVDEEINESLFDYLNKKI